MSHSEHYGVVTITSGQTSSPEVIVPERYVMVGILAPATLPEVVTVQVAERSGGTFRALQSAGADVTIAASKAIVVTNMPFSTLRLTAGAAVAADRTFHYVMRMVGV